MTKTVVKKRATPRPVQIITMEEELEKESCYFVCEGIDIPHLEAEVIEKIEKGYKPVGGITNTTYVGEMGARRMVYLQAVVKLAQSE